MRAGVRRSGWRLPLRWSAESAVALTLTLLSTPAWADPPEDGLPRAAALTWDPSGQVVLVTTSFRDAVDQAIGEKLSRGLPVTILFTAIAFRSDQPDPVSSTAQTCKITWHVWEEAYRLEISSPGSQQSRWTTTLEGVLRRCAEVHQLPLADRRRLAPGVSVVLKAHVEVNPVSPGVVLQIKRWISRPSATSVARPGDALFSTFTGLFMKRIGVAERQLRFTTLPILLPPPPRGAPPPPAS